MPQMFFAFNNGISVTASNVVVETTDHGRFITYARDFQIINGGQTTASIANTLLTARREEVVDISRLYVPMKVSVLDHSMSEKIIEEIIKLYSLDSNESLSLKHLG